MRIRFPKRGLPTVAGLILFFYAFLHSPALCLAADYEPKEILRHHYQEFLDRDPAFGMPPIEVHSLDDEDRLHAEVFGILEQPFAELAEALVDPAEWCEFIPLNFNIKACTYHRVGGQPVLTFYAGRKVYQTPEEAFRLQYVFEVRERKEDYLRITLESQEGPMGTSDYHILLEAMAVEEGAFVRFRSSYRPSLWSRMATTGYLATLGRDKVGFSVVGQDEAGRPIFVKGVEGIVERNAVRYFLALKAYMIHRDLPPDRRYQRLIETWIRLNDSYPVQLRELDPEEYMRIKKKERENQLQLQERVEEDVSFQPDVRRLPGRSSDPRSPWRKRPEDRTAGASRIHPGTWALR